MKSNPDPVCLKISESADGITISIHVQPKASRNEITGTHDGEMRIRLTSPPVEGAANRLCIEYLAKLLKTPKSSITIIGGDKSRHKTIRISAMSRTQFLEQLASTGINL
jgi:hypothetical protein